MFCNLNAILINDLVYQLDHMQIDLILLSHHLPFIKDFPYSIAY